MTLDTGALIQLASRKRILWAELEAVLHEELPIHVPAAAVAEFWRGGHGRAIAALIEGAAVPDSLHDARSAGQALAAVGKRGRGPSVVDAIVAAVASRHGDIVLTADPDDFGTPAQHFRGLKVVAV